MGAELPGRNSSRVDNGVTPENPTGAPVSGFGNVLTQAWIVHDLDQRWAAALGEQLIAPTSTNGVASDAWEQVTILTVRAMLPEISPGSFVASASSITAASSLHKANGETVARRILATAATSCRRHCLRNRFRNEPGAPENL